MHEVSSHEVDGSHEFQTAGFCTSLQPVRTFELFASIRGGGHAERKTFVVIPTSVRASASACKGQHVSGMHM